MIGVFTPERLVSMKFRVKSQLDHEEKGGILDDCGPSSMAAAVSWVFKYAPGHDFSAGDGIAAKQKATGHIDKQGVADNGSSLGDLIKTARVLGAEARWAKDWNDVVESCKKGAALGVWVQQPIGYPEGVGISAWHRKWAKWWGPGGGGFKKDPKHYNAGYGHMTAAAWDPEEGWQWACPTRSGKGAEEFAVKVTEAQLKAIADSKRVSGVHKAPPEKHVIIITAPKGWVAPKPAAAPVAPAAPAPQPAAPVKEVPCPRCGGTGKVK
jgi:hypothetical protein